MTVRLSRGGGGYGGYAESLDIGDDGTFTMVRRYSGRRAGHFAGRLDGDTAARLDRLVTAAVDEPSDDQDTTATDGTDPAAPPPPIKPESSTDVIDLGDVGRSFDVWDEPEGPWGELLALLRQLMETLLDQPVSALEFSVGRDEPSATLRYVGTEPVHLAGDPIDAQATLMDQQSRTLGSWRRQVEVPAGDVGPGWEMDLGLDSNAFDVQPGTGYVASVSVPVIVGAAHLTWKLHGTGGEGWDE